MKKSEIKNSIVYLFLVLFLSVKMAGLHAFFHEDQDDDHAKTCVVCENVIINNLTPVLNSPVQDYQLETPNIQLYKETFNLNTFIVISSIEVNQLFSRPPPYLQSIL